jgi:hypothetical protein
MKPSIYLGALVVALLLAACSGVDVRPTNVGESIMLADENIGTLATAVATARREDVISRDRAIGMLDDLERAAGWVDLARGAYLADRGADADDYLQRAILIAEAIHAALPRGTP